MSEANLVTPAAIEAQILERGRKVERERVLEILMAEFQLWESPDVEDGLNDSAVAIKIGAIGALSNVIARLTGAQR